MWSDLLLQTFLQTFCPVLHLWKGFDRLYIPSLIFVGTSFRYKTLHVPLLSISVKTRYFKLFLGTYKDRSESFFENDDHVFLDRLIHIIFYLNK